MSKKNHRIAPEVREQVLKRIKDEGLPVIQAAKEHGISEAAIYRWLGKSASGAEVPRMLGFLGRLLGLCEVSVLVVGERRRSCLGHGVRVREITHEFFTF